MAEIFIQVVFVFYLNLFKYTVLSEDTHAVITSANYESFVDNMQKTYFLDKNETIQVWAKVVPFPWQDNRLIPGISDPFLLELNASCVEDVVSKGVVTRNMTVQISQVPRNANTSSTQDKTGNATFHVGIFEESQDETLRVETEIIVGCPPGRNISVYRSVENCPAFENYTFTIPSGHYRSDFISPFSPATTPKTVQYDFTSLGCPLQGNYYDIFKPKLQLYENGEFLRNVSASYVVFELNGRTDYSFVATMAEVGCLREAQTYQKMIDDIKHLSDVSFAWTPQNYQSCFDNVENGNMYQPYEILNETGLSALTWESEGVYVFKATVIDPEYSFCNLTTVFAVRVSGMQRDHDELIPFLVLGTSIFGLFSVIFIVFVTSNTF
ncbi:cation channel sperm-associated subunit epsilon-like [Paramuricea clavata]|uniref:Cation channel sperm-associated subunit epsilon-like n=1 Tax=Paramuricea clavata TaxID=317549 RepID=A0A7D9DEV5_PARCT|nr:cation channel sperm-associated subunit epsilon-like [Paramuricea clavata]